MGMSPKVKEVDPNQKWMKPVQQTAANFSQGVMQGNNPFAGMVSPLQQQAVGHLGSFINQPAPETKALDAASPVLQQIMGSANAEGVRAAYQPVWENALQSANAQLSNAAPGRFSSAFVSQGNDLGSQALRDFNLFQQQALTQAQGNAMQAAGTLGGLAGQAGMNPFQRALGMSEMGNQLSMQQINPMLQLLLGSQQFGTPMGLNHIGGPSNFQQIMGGVGSLAQLVSAIKQ